MSSPVRSTPALHTAAASAARALAGARSQLTRRWASRRLRALRAELAARRWVQAMWLAQACRIRRDARGHARALHTAAACRRQVAGFRKAVRYASAV